MYLWKQNLKSRSQVSMCSWDGNCKFLFVSGNIFNSGQNVLCYKFYRIVLSFCIDHRFSCIVLLSCVASSGWVFGHRFVLSFCKIGFRASSLFVAASVFGHGLFLLRHRFLPIFPFCLHHLFLRIVFCIAPSGRIWCIVLLFFCCDIGIVTLRCVVMVLFWTRIHKTS